MSSSRGGGSDLSTRLRAGRSAQDAEGIIKWIAIRVAGEKKNKTGHAPRLLQRMKVGYRVLNLFSAITLAGATDFEAAECGFCDCGDKFYKM